MIFYYRIFHRKIKLSGKFKGSTNFVKIESSLRNWITYFNMGEQEKNGVVGKIMKFLSFSWGDMSYEEK